MIFWAVALLVWVAAGARLGRVVARTATPDGMSLTPLPQQLYRNL